MRSLPLTLNVRGAYLCRDNKSTSIVDAMAMAVTRVVTQETQNITKHLGPDANDLGTSFIVVPQVDIRGYNGTSELVTRQLINNLTELTRAFKEFGGPSDRYPNCIDFYRPTETTE